LKNIPYTETERLGTTMAKNRSIEIYLKSGIEEDDQIYEVWQSLSMRGRPQEIFRRLILLGLRSAVEKGELPLAAMQVIDTNILVPSPIHSFFRQGQNPKVETPIRKRGRPAVKGKQDENGKKVELTKEAVHNEFNGPFSRILGENIDDKPKTPRDAVTQEAKPEVKQKPKLGRLM
jgi:hypothetical protein